MRDYLPYCWPRIMGCDSSLCPVSEDTAARYNAAMRRAMRTLGFPLLCDASLHEADECLKKFGTAALQTIGIALVTEARAAHLRGPAITKFHLLAQCVADLLSARGAALP